MALTLFASIDVGSNELAMKVYEISKKNGIHEIDYARHPLELGSETYTNGKLSHDLIDEICLVLEKFNLKLKEYKITDYIVCATSGIREASNQILILDQIKIRTGMKVKVLSNSEQRFLCYKALATQYEQFQKSISNGAVIVDVGAGSIQISLFDNQTLLSTQNIKLGSLRIRELLSSIELQTTHYDHLIEEYIDTYLTTYETFMFGGIKIKRIIAFGDQLNDFVRLSRKIEYGKSITKEQFFSFYQNLTKKSLEQLSKDLSLPKEQASLLLPTTMIYAKMLEITEAEDLILCNVTLCDGIAADYALKKNKLSISHDFEQDIIHAARMIARHYHCNTVHSENVEFIALKLFDCLKRVHGLGKRERLYLQIAVILHNCGEYISMNEVAQNSYHIILSTEIIGLSHQERELIANLVRYRIYNFPSYSRSLEGIDPETYITISKLTAILRLANALDKSHKQKFSHIQVQLKDDELLISTTTIEDITLEQGLFVEKANFFEEVYGIRPILKQKRSTGL